MGKQESTVSRTVLFVEDLAVDQAIRVEDKIIKVVELYTQQKQEDCELFICKLSEIQLVLCQKQQCKDMGMIIFGFILYNEQIWQEAYLSTPFIHVNAAWNSHYNYAIKTPRSRIKLNN